MDKDRGERRRANKRERTNLLAVMIFTYLGDLRASLLYETQNVSALSEPEREKGEGEMVLGEGREQR